MVNDHLNVTTNWSSFMNFIYSSSRCVNGNHLESLWKGFPSLVERTSQARKKFFFSHLSLLFSLSCILPTLSLLLSDSFLLIIYIIKVIYNCLYFYLHCIYFRFTTWFYFYKYLLLKTLWKKYGINFSSWFNFNLISFSWSRLPSSFISFTWSVPLTNIFSVCSPFPSTWKLVSSLYFSLLQCESLREKTLCEDSLCFFRQPKCIKNKSSQKYFLIYIYIYISSILSFFFLGLINSKF